MHENKSICIIFFKKIIIQTKFKKEKENFLKNISENKFLSSKQYSDKYFRNKRRKNIHQK